MHMCTNVYVYIHEEINRYVYMIMIVYVLVLSGENMQCLPSSRAAVRRRIQHNSACSWPWCVAVSISWVRLKWAQGFFKGDVGDDTREV